MPFIVVHWLEGRSAEQKSALARQFTEALVSIGKANPEQTNIIFNDYPTGDWARDYGLLSNRKRV